LTIKRTVLILACGLGLLAQADGPWMGTWKLNLAKSSYSPGPGPVPGTVTIFRMMPQKDGFLYTVDTTPPNGKPTHSEAFARFDGKDYPEVGNPAADTNRFHRIDDRTYGLTDRRNGADALSFRVTISVDGKTRTSVATGKNASGRQVHNVGVWDRQ
jgi:hypothetical protein